MANLHLVKRLKWFIFVFVAICGSSLPGIALPGITLFPLRIIVVFWIIFQIIEKVRVEHRLTIKIQPIYMALLLFILYGFVTLIWTCNLRASITSIIIYLTSIFSLVICKSCCEKELSVQYVTEAFYVSMIVVSIISIYESLSGNYIVPSYDYYLFTYNMFGLYRPKAIFYNTNNLTVFFVTCLPIAMYAAEHWKYRNIAKIVITILTVTVVLLTGSRTGVIALLLFCAFYLYYMLYYANHSKIVLLFIIVVIIAGIIIFFTPQLYQYITGGNSMGDEDRLPIWECAFKACKEYWFMGAGPGTSAYVNGSMGLTHNYSLEICLEFGIVGLVVFLFVIKSIILPSKKIKKDCLLMYFRSFIWIFLICTICPSSMQGYYYIWVIFGVCLAVKNIS